MTNRQMSNRGSPGVRPAPDKVCFLTKREAQEAAWCAFVLFPPETHPSPSGLQPGFSTCDAAGQCLATALFATLTGSSSLSPASGRALAQTDPEERGFTPSLSACKGDALPLSTTPCPFSSPFSNLQLGTCSCHSKRGTPEATRTGREAGKQPVCTGGGDEGLQELNCELRSRRTEPQHD